MQKLLFPGCALQAFTLMIACLSAGTALGQSDAVPLDDITERSTIQDRAVLKPAPVREADILYEKRIWRVLDVREKLNLPFAAPEAPLFSILSTSAMKGDLTVYSVENDRFTRPLSVDDLDGILFETDTIAIENFETGEQEIKVIRNEVNWEDVKRFRIKESWFFDARYGCLRVRILGIAPMINVLDEDGNFRYEKPLFWVHLPSARALLAQHKVVTPGGNYATTLSWDDWLDMRYFASYITKENSVHDLRLQDQYAGVDLLQESQKIQDALFNFEQDMWQR